MDLHKTIQELCAERDRLERLISSLEQLQNSAAVHMGAGKRRGRKFMGAKERQEVSARMKRYWASQREARGAG